MSSEEIKKFEKHCLSLEIVDHGFSQRQLEEMTFEQAQASVDVAHKIATRDSDMLRENEKNTSTPQDRCFFIFYNTLLSILSIKNFIISS